MLYNEPSIYNLLVGTLTGTLMNDGK